MKGVMSILMAVVYFTSTPAFSYTYVAIDTGEKQDLVESAIRCKGILRPLWNELILMKDMPAFQQQFMASDVAQRWLVRVKQAQELDMPSHLSMEEKAKVSSCFRDFTLIGADALGFFLPIEMWDIVRAFRYNGFNPEGAIMKAHQIQDWLVWAAGLDP